MNNPKNEPIHLDELGEFNLIRRLTGNISLFHKETIKGVGDDAAVVSCGDKCLVITTDMLMEGIHFDLVYTPLKHLGYKAAVVNLSDVYAMNAIPQQLLISIAVSGKFSVQALDEFYSGLKLACENYQVDLIGGDTSSSLTGLAISITVIGKANREKITYRNGAGEGDLICVTGDLGASYIGLQVLEREKKVFIDSKGGQPLLDEYDYILRRQLKPEARKDIIDFFSDNNIQPTSMIDISDGLSSELLHICSNSNVGCKIYEQKIPIDQQTAKVAKELGYEPLICALNGGEDYELLFTLPLQNYDIITKKKDISIIGHIVSKNEGCNLITRLDQQIPIVAQGWNAYNGN